MATHVATKSRARVAAHRFSAFATRPTKQTTARAARPPANYLQTGRCRDSCVKIGQRLLKNLVERYARLRRAASVRTPPACALRTHASACRFVRTLRVRASVRTPPACRSLDCVRSLMQHAGGVRTD
jgi:hypothetical protein